MNDLVKKADAFAAKAHEGQTDKAGLPYITHPRAVAAMIEDETAKVAALLHDTVEDTDVTLEEIRAEFGDEIAAAVDLLTHRPGVDYFEYVAGVKNDPVAWRVKLADLTHNMDLSRIPSPTDADFARIEKYKKAYAILTEGLVRPDGTSDVLTEREILHAASQFRLNDDSGIISGKESGYDHSLTPEESRERIRRMREEILKRLEELGYGKADKK